jgi:NitT/TauT family transport system substrate-binding protein
VTAIIERNHVGTLAWPDSDKGSFIGYRIAVTLAASAFALVATMAEAQTIVRLGKQFGIAYLPLTIMEHKKVLEEHGRRRGLDLKAEWMQFASGERINEAILSSSLDLGSGGIGPLLRIWGKTQGNIGIKGVAALSSMPLYLNTVNPNVKSIRDFSDKDRIALPAVKTSIQAITLQMAAEKTFGLGQHGRLDHLTVSLSHPDGMAAMLGGGSEISAHFTSAPFMYQELEDKRVEKVISSYDVVGGPHTFTVVWATTKFARNKRKVLEAFVAALDDVMQQIARDPAAAAALWVRAENSKLSPEYVRMLIRLNEWTMVPKNIMPYADFMHRTGLLPVKPSKWQEVFFPNTHNLPGS